jgi:cell division protein FtsL
VKPAITPAKRKPAARPRRRGWRHPTFLLFAAMVVSVMVIGLVALNALLVQTTYRMQTVRQEVSDLSEQQVRLADAVASLSSPQTVARWARLQGMTSPQPGDTIILPVPGVTSSPDASAGAGG